MRAQEWLATSRHSTRVGTVHVAQVPGTIERMKPRVGEFGRVADVVQPRGGFEQLGVVTEDRSQGPGLRGDTLDVGPATRQRDFEELAGQFFGPESLIHALQATKSAPGRAPTRRAVWGRLTASQGVGSG